jgi:hypothetical protein
MISVTFLSPSKHGPLTISITARPLIYTCIITHQSIYPIIIQQSYTNHTASDVTVSPSLAVCQNDNYFMDGSLECRRVVW